MGLLPILLLCSYCLQSFASPVPAIDVDCDDPNIFEAVDEALKSYNGAKLDGNMFILYRITEASIRQETPSLIHHFVSFDIWESICPVKDAVPWKECEFKLDDAERGQCSAHIFVNKEQNTKEVFSQNCSITPKVIEPTIKAAVAPCLGCSELVNPNSEELSPLIQSAIEKMNRLGNHPFYFDLENIEKASRQVVRGWNYILTYEVRQTNCSKSLYPKWSAEECKIDFNGHKGHCTTRIFVDPYGEIQDVNPDCYSSSGFCLNCPNAVEASDPEVQALAKKFVEKYNSESNATAVYAVDKVTRATKDLNHFLCKVTVDVVNGASDILPESACHPPNIVSLAARASMKGFSPLRSVLASPLCAAREKRAAEKSKGHGPNKHKEEKHGKKDKKDKKDKDKGKHGGKKDRSSEESEEDHRKPVPKKDATLPPLTEKTTKLPEVQPPTPTIANLPSTSQRVTIAPDFQETTKPDLSSTTLTQHNEENLPSIDETILDLLFPTPPNARKCPGKEWKPLLPIPPIPTENTFVIGDLVPAVDDLVPPEEKSLNLNPPGLLTDEDLLHALDF